eukprot:TRINITY_DN3068_c7_g1_i1.p1 TRINITY_DN3068_c7_g1~~TRINITY_DN3068_c7_g1_i1.p1  ORF type:complete len:402 (+),score=90.65 TRINITY_DN3068_c7_g1_i1:564-1769(+)
MAFELNREIGKIIRGLVSLKIDERSVKEIKGVHFSMISACEYSLDGKYLAICDDNKVHIIDDETGRLNCTISGCAFPFLVHSVAFSYDGKMLATCSNDRFINIFNLQDFSLMFKLSKNTGVDAICFSHCSKYIYSTDCRGSIRKWNIESKSIVLEERIHRHKIFCLRPSLTGRYLLTGSKDCSAKLIDPNNFAIVRTFSNNGSVRGIDFHPTKKIVAVGDQSGIVKLWNIKDETVVHTFRMELEIYNLRFLTSTILLLLSKDGYITTYNVDTFQEIQKIHLGCDLGSFSIAISPDISQMSCVLCKHEIIKVYSLKYDFDPSHQSRLIEISKDGGYVLSAFVEMKMDTKFIRQFVSAGICMNKEEYDMISDMCWDLIDVNTIKGGNIREFVDIQVDESESDS